MSHRLTIEELKTEWKIADHEGKEYLKITTTEKEYTLNAIATIKMNACTQIKNHIQNRIGRIIVEEKNETL